MLAPPSLPENSTPAVTSLIACLNSNIPCFCSEFCSLIALVRSCLARTSIALASSCCGVLASTTDLLRAFRLLMILMEKLLRLDSNTLAVAPSLSPAILSGSIIFITSLATASLCACILSCFALSLAASLIASFVSASDCANSPTIMLRALPLNAPSVSPDC